MKFRRLRPAVSLVALTLSLGALGLNQGCVAVVAGAGAGAAVAWVRGDLETTLDVGLDKGVDAANAAITQLKFAKVSEKKDALQAILIARTAADKKIEIRIEHQAAKLSKLKIRVGLFGEEALSLAILEKIKANL